MRRRRDFHEVTSNVYGNGHTALYADMIDAIKNDRAPYVMPLPGCSSLEIVLAIYKVRRPTSLSSFLQNFASIDMAGEFGK